MWIGKSARLVLFVAAAMAAVAAPTRAQGAGDGYLFTHPRVTFSVYGGLAAPIARGSLWDFTTSELTLSRNDFQSSTFGADVGIALTPRTELVFGFTNSSSRQGSEFRDWVDNNDLPIEQTTSFARTPITAGVRYYLTERGRMVGSVAWIPKRFVPYVSAGAGFTRFRFEQRGDFIDMQTLNVFGDVLQSNGWARSLQAGAGAQWNLSTRFQLTGELRYLHSSTDASRGAGDYVGYTLDLSGVTTLLGFTLRL